MRLQYFLKRDNFYLYRIPLFQGINNLRLSKIIIEDKEQQIDPIDWDQIQSTDFLRYVLYNYSGEIEVFYE